MLPSCTECDKSFTRADALQKHMRIQHGDKIIAVGRRPGATATTGTTTKKGKKSARAASVDSADGGEYDPGDDGGGGADGDPAAAAAADDDNYNDTISASDLSHYAAHPDQSLYFQAYVLTLARYRHSMREHEELAFELEALTAREGELKGQCEVLMGAVMRKELAGGDGHAEGAMSGGVEQEKQELETFLTRYGHADGLRGMGTPQQP